MWLKSRANWDCVDQACLVLNIVNAISIPYPMTKINQVLMAILVRHTPRKAIKIGQMISHDLMIHAGMLIMTDGD